MNVLETLIKRAVVKRDLLFEYYETADMTRNYEYYKICKLGTDLVTSHKYNENDFIGIDFINTNGKTRNVIINLIKADSGNIYNFVEPQTIELLRDAKAQYMIDHYVEKNDYIRTLAGLPLSSEKESDYITLAGYGFTATDLYRVRTNVYIHLLDPEEITRISNNGVLDQLKLILWDKDYIKYLDRKTDFIKAREADNYDLLYADGYGISADYIELFQSEYEKNRTYFYYVLRNTFYENYKDNYDAVSIIYLLFSTLISCTITTTETIYDYESGDLDLINAILGSVNIKDVVLPEIFMSRLLDNLNTLIQYKGTKKAMINIKNIFELSNIYRYVLQRKPIATCYEINGIQNDNTLIPVLSEGQRYIIMNKDNIHSTFGVIPGLKNNDVVEYVNNAFTVVDLDGLIVENYIHAVLMPISSISTNDDGKKLFYDNADSYTYYRYDKVHNVWENRTAYPTDRYQLVFHRINIEETDVNAAISSSKNIVSYKDMIKDDLLWGSPTSNLYDELTAEEFNIIESKYIGIENMYEVTKATYNMFTLFRYIMNNKSNYSGLYSLTHKRGTSFTFNLFDGLVYMVLLLITYRGYKDVIPDSIPDITYIMGMNTDQDFKQYNINFDTGRLEDSTFYSYKQLFEKYFSEDSGYRILLSDNSSMKTINFKRMENITDVYTFMEMFANQKDALDLLEEIINNTQDYTEYTLAKRLYDSITTNATLKTVFTEENMTYDSYIKTQNRTLWDYFDDIRGDKTAVREELVYIIDLLLSFLNSENDEYMAEHLSPLNMIKDELSEEFINSIKNIVKYFKSLSVELRDFATVFIYDNMLHRFAVLDRMITIDTTRDVERVAITEDKSVLVENITYKESVSMKDCCIFIDNCGIN